MEKYIDILNKWAKFTNYDPNQETFNLATWNYELHKLNKKLEFILKNFDSTGALAVIQAKITFEEIMSQSNIKILDILKNPDVLIKEKEMYELFYSDVVLNAEESYMAAINKITNKIISIKLIGKENIEATKKLLFETTDIVLTSLGKCNEDLFIKGGEILPIRQFSTYIHVFETLANCLTALETAEDGLYLCYINIGSTADGYFGFYLKNNGNILSINERIDEAYQGAHSYSRNARWSDAKQYEMFPYDYIFSYTEHDYKGISTKHIINEENLAFFELGAEAYFPIIVAMVMINQKYCGKVLELPVKYVDSLLQVNINNAIAADNTSLAIVNNSALIESHKAANLFFDLDRVLKGEYASEFQWSDSKCYKETGIFDNSNQLFVDLWGQGFNFDNESLYESSSLLRLTDKEANVTSEFVGTEARMRLQGYYKLRKQLAEYIRDKMYKEWIAFGKTSAVVNWYLNAVRNNIDSIEKMAVMKFLDTKYGKTNLSAGWSSIDKNIKTDIYYIEGLYPIGHYPVSILNNEKQQGIGNYIDTRTGTICNIFFVFNPKDWKAIKELVNCHVPKIVTGWTQNSHRSKGNSILNATDAVDEIGTPFEYDESNRNKRYEHQHSYYNFAFAIGMSKRSLNQLTKKYENEYVKDIEKSSDINDKINPTF